MLNVRVVSVAENSHRGAIYVMVQRGMWCEVS